MNCLLFPPPTFTPRSESQSNPAVSKIMMAYCKIAFVFFDGPIAGRLGQFVLRVGKHQPRFKAFCFLQLHGGIRNDDDDVADGRLPGSWPVHAYYTTVPLTPDHVGF